VGLADGAPAQELDPGLERREVRLSTAKRRDQSCGAHQMEFFARIEEDSSIRRAQCSMNKSLPGRDLAAACAELLQRAQLVRVSSRVAGRAQAEFGDGARPRARGWPARWSGDVVSSARRLVTTRRGACGEAEKRRRGSSG
jgi:hypothetical protein